MGRSAIIWVVPFYGLDRRTALKTENEMSARTNLFIFLLFHTAAAMNDFHAMMDYTFKLGAKMTPALTCSCHSHKAVAKAADSTLTPAFLQPELA